MADMISMANELAFRTALVTSNQLPGDPTLTAMFSTSSLSLTAAQPEILSPNLTTTNRTLHQKSPMTTVTQETVYKTERGWLAGGFVVMCLSCLAIIPSYWGWWRLGREVIMSPLEIARAFDAPMMQQADPNATGDDLKRELGGIKVRFAADSDGMVYDTRGDTIR